MTTHSRRFIEIPRSQNVSVNETAEFRCQHSTTDGIRWKVNGSVLRPIDFPPGVQQKVENRLYILTIIGMPEYNGTEVVGDAFHFYDGSSLEETEPAALLLGNSIINNVVVITNTHTGKGGISSEITLDPRKLE